MFSLQDIIRTIQKGAYRISDHADEESFSDRLKFEDVAFSVQTGEVIESYPKDKPFPSCLVYGMTEKHEPVHSVWAYDKNKDASVLVTVYRPDAERWIDFKRRKI